MHSYTLSHLADSTLLKHLALLVAQDRTTTAGLLAHIAEVDEHPLGIELGALQRDHGPSVVAMQVFAFPLVIQEPVPVIYDGVKLDVGFRLDLLVEDLVIIELKSVEQVSQAHKKQIQTYLRLTGCKLGFVFNFGEALMKRGITRAVNGLPDE